MPLPQSLYVPLPADTAEALRDLAVREYRHPKAQAAYLIAEALRRRGALPPEPAAPVTRATGHEAAE
jgi:hypothetical protein